MDAAKAMNHEPKGNHSKIFENKNSKGNHR